MPTLDEQLTQSRDRITDLLTKNRPSQGDIGSAMLRAVTGRTSYGDELNRIKASRLGEQKTLYDVLSGHKKIKQAGRKMVIAEGKVSASAAGAEQQNWIAAAKELGDKLSTQDRASLLQGMKSDPNSKTDPWGVGARIVKELGLRTYEKPTHPSIDMEKVKDESSLTGWSWQSPSGDKLSGAPAPTGGQEITVDKDGNIRIGPMTKTQAGKRTQEALDEVDRNQANIAEISKVLRKLEKVPSAAGIPGYLIEKLGGLIEQTPLFGEVAGEWLGTKEVTEIRTDMISLIGRFIAPITGDESGRYSDKDLALVELAERGRDPLASKPMVVAALNAIRDISFAEQARGRMRLDDIPDLTGDIGRQAYGEQLMAQGKSAEEATRELLQALEKYNIPESYWRE